jgi:hypothetical protein
MRRVAIGARTVPTRELNGAGGWRRVPHAAGWLRHLHASGLADREQVMPGAVAADSAPSRRESGQVGDGRRGCCKRQGGSLHFFFSHYWAWWAPCRQLSFGGRFRTVLPVNNRKICTAQSLQRHDFIIRTWLTGLRQAFLGKLGGNFVP